MYMIMGWDELTEETATWTTGESLVYAKTLIKELSLIKAYGEPRYTELKLYKEIEL